MEFTFKLSEQEAVTVINALAKEPYVQVVDVINKLQTQAFQQQHADEERRESENAEGKDQ